MGYGMSARMLAKGLLTWIPGIHRAFFDPHAGGGTASADYCYGVWMKHLTLLRASGMQDMPQTVLELGPGSSIGTGVATLLSGAERYIAVDTSPHMQTDANLAVYRGLLELFRKRAPRPTAGWPHFEQYLDARLFPSHILDEERLAAALAPERLGRIEAAVRALATDSPREEIRYSTWATLDHIPDASVDLVFSHVVMNHVEHLDDVYGHCARWLKPGGWMSHQVDFSSLGTAHDWNGHRAYSELAWKIISGKRPYFVNREPFSTHVQLLEGLGFDVVGAQRCYMHGGITRDQLAPRWRGMSAEDFATDTGFFVCRKK